MPFIQDEWPDPSGRTPLVAQIRDFQVVIGAFSQRTPDSFGASCELPAFLDGHTDDARHVRALIHEHLGEDVLQRVEVRARMWLQRYG